MRFLLGLALLAACGLTACAEVGRPPGGPVDRTPPELTEATPGSLRTDVDPRAPLRLTFSEKVDRRRAPRAVTFIPDVEMENPRFDDTSVEFRPREGWPADTVVVWVLQPDLPDKHGVKLGTEVTGAFTTGKSFPPGEIRGRASLAVPAEEETDWTQLRAELDLPPPEGSRRRVRWRVASGDEEGRFRLPWLDLPSGPYLLSVYLDANDNATRDAREPVADLDSLFLAATDSIFEIDAALLRLVDLEGPVPVRFCLREAMADTAAGVVDSLFVRVWARGTEEERPRMGVIDSLGCVDLELPPGDVVYGAWLDDGDAAFGVDSLGVSEAFLWPDTLVVAPAVPDTVLLDRPTMRLERSALDTLRTPPVPADLSTDSPRGR